jgi:hypothetical protein
MSKMSNLHARLTEDGMIPDGPDDSDWDAPPAPLPGCHPECDSPVLRQENERLRDALRQLRSALGLYPHWKPTMCRRLTDAIDKALGEDGP